MTDERPQQPFHSRTGYRVLSGCFGVFLCTVGAYMLLVTPAADLLKWFAASALLILGGNMTYSAINAKESWLSKLGPLP